jgi:hypothetical protein
MASFSWSCFFLSFLFEDCLSLSSDLDLSFFFLSFLLDEALELEFEADESFVDVVLAEWLNELELEPEFVM